MDISEQSKDFIKCLLTINPNDRLSAKEALQHSWLKVENDDNNGGIVNGFM